MDNNENLEGSKPSSKKDLGDIDEGTTELKGSKESAYDRKRGTQENNVGNQNLGRNKGGNI